MSVLPTGFGVLVTRPVEQAEVLCGLIEEAGGKAFRLPLLEIQAVGDHEPGPSRLRSLEDADWLVFVSANAVRCAIALLGPKWLPSQALKIAAIGWATAKELLANGVAADLMPEPPFNSESLLAQPEWRDVNGLRFVIVRGVGGRELLADTLRERGGLVSYAEVYRRCSPAIDMNALLESWRRGDIGVSTFTSSEALVKLFNQIPVDQRGLLLETPMIVIGERMASQAHELGVLHVAAVEAGDADLFNAVMRIAQEINQTHQPRG